MDKVAGVGRDVSIAAVGARVDPSERKVGRPCIKRGIRPMPKDVFKKMMQEFKGEPADLIPVLQRIQEAEGYLPAEATRRVSRWLKVSENEIKKLFKGVLVEYIRLGQGQKVKQHDVNMGKRSEYWKYFIWIVLILLALETFLAQYFGDFEGRAARRRKKQK